MSTPIIAQPANQINRANVNHTLNFRIPAGLCTDRLIAYAQVWDSTRSPNETEYSSEAAPGTVMTFLEQNRLPVYVVRIIYTGPDATGKPLRLGPPSEDDVINTLTNSYVSKVYPVNAIDNTGSSTAEFNGDLTTTGPSGCGKGWG